jgi:hypothetical protein
MWRLAPIPFLAHSLGMLVDEAWFHRRRNLPPWERWGHPLDTLTVLACYGLVLALPPTRGGLALYLAMAAFSSLFVTKDEWIHARHCSGGEMWLHACLFVLHPILLGIAGAWRFASLFVGHGNLNVTIPIESASDAGRGFFALFLAGQTALTALFLCYQLLYWNGPWKPALPSPQ